MLAIRSLERLIGPINWAWRRGVIAILANIRRDCGRCADVIADRARPSGTLSISRGSSGRQLGDAVQHPVDGRASVGAWAIA